MPTTIRGYHLFQAQCSVRDSASSIEFNELENDLGDSYYDQMLYGSETGNRAWALTLPTLPDGTLDGNTVTGINGETLSRAEYIWDLFCETKVTGDPFVFQDPRNGQYYLVRFAESRLTLERMLTKLYSTGITLKQWRQDGESAFTPAVIPQTWAAYDAESFPGGFGFAWADESENGNHLANVNGDVVAGTSGSLPIVRFSLTTNDGFLDSTIASVLAKDIFILMKMREATFSNFAGIMSADTGVVALLGDTGETKFFDLSFGANYQYRLDGLEYAENDQQAPMNEWGVVHLRHTDGIPLVNLQMGKDRGNAGRYAEMDVAYVIISDELFPKSTIREIDEFLAVWKSKLA